MQVMIFVDEGEEEGKKSTNVYISKGQLISKCPFSVIAWTKIPMKCF
jgi:hypothetical protein